MLNPNQTKNPLQLDDVLPKIMSNPLGKPLKHIIEKSLGISYLAKGYDELNTNGQPADFIKQAFRSLNIDYKLAHGSIENIPGTGATIVVSNHPYGAIDGMAMIDLLKTRRDDIKVMANGFLKRVPEISDVILSVNPYGHKEATKQNAAAMRECLRWLNKGGLIFMFPAGDVSSLKISKLSITDTEWDTKVIRLAKKTGAAVVPVHIEGKNSPSFYLAGAIHPKLRTLLLPRQIIKKRGSTINIRIGKTINANKLLKLDSDQERSELLKSRTYLLAKNNQQKNISRPLLENIMQAIPINILALEVDLLPEKQKLIGSGDMQVCYAMKNQIPGLMQEIGRLREISFRDAGEGTGQEIDIDKYDSHYIQLFIWNTKTKEVVGGYRLGLTDEILKEHSLNGLYSHSLFKLSNTFLNNTPPSIELGRSFVRIEYQKSFTPLLLLWKGIASFVSQNPKYCILFGPVSISNDYCSASKKVLIQYLKKHLSDVSLAKLVKPRSPYKDKKIKNITLSNTNNFSLDQLSSMIASFEEDGKGIPVLIRQYLKLGGKLLGFNVDSDFGDCIDGLIRIDLRKTELKTLSKYMGKDEAQTYTEYHKKSLRKVS